MSEDWPIPVGPLFQLPALLGWEENWLLSSLSVDITQAVCSPPNKSAHLKSDKAVPYLASVDLYRYVLVSSTVWTEWHVVLCQENGQVK